MNAARFGTLRDWQVHSISDTMGDGVAQELETLNKNITDGLMCVRVVCFSILLMLFACSCLFAQTRKQLEWMKNHPNSPVTKKWVKNNPDHPALRRFKARRAIPSDELAKAEHSKPTPKERREVGPRRIWTDVSGTFRVEAALVELKETEVTLKRVKNGESITLPLTKLSEKDKQHLNSWMQLSPETKISVITKDIERRCKIEIAAQEREKKGYTSRLERFRVQSSKKKKLLRDDVWVLEELTNRRDRTAREDVRRDYDAAIVRWGKMEPTEADLRTGHSIVLGRLQNGVSECDRRIRELQDELKWAFRRTTHLIKRDDSPYVAISGGFYTETELAKAEKEAADLATLKKEMAIPRAAADSYVRRLLDTTTIQRAVFVAEDVVKLDPRWRVPGNQLDPKSYRSLFYQVDYVSAAGIRMQKQGAVVVQRVPEGYWKLKEGFDFVVFPLWTPSGADLERAFGSGEGSRPLPPRNLDGPPFR